MAASSFINFSLSSHLYRNPTPKSPHPTIFRNLTKSLILTSSSSLHRHPELRKLTGKLRISPKPSISAIFSPPQKKILSFLVEKIAALLLGSLIFAGCVRARPALAVPVQESGVFEEKKDEGEEMCMKLLQENPRDPEVLKMVVNVKMRRGKTREAVESVEKLIELQPNEMEWRLLQALCYEMMGDLSKAKSLFKNILKQKPLLLRALHV